MRATMHCGKRGSLKHNKHDENTKGASWDKTKTKNNVSYNPYGCKDTVEAEAYVYKKLYSEALAKQNAKYIAKRQYKRVRDMDTWKEASQYRACETIWQIGNKDESVDATVFAECINEMIQWKVDTYPNYSVIGVDIHVDETTLHCHERGTWFYHNEAGDIVPGIKGAMREMGVALPNPNEPESKTNYRKAVIDAECRAKWQEICKAHGLEIETEPDRDREVGHMGIKPYKAYVKAKEDLDVREEEAEVLLEANQKWSESLKQQEETIKQQVLDNMRSKRAIQEREEALKAYESDLKAFRDDLQRQVDNFTLEREKWLDEANTALEDEKKQLRDQYDMFCNDLQQKLSLEYRRSSGRPLPQGIKDMIEQSKDDFTNNFSL